MNGNRNGTIILLADDMLENRLVLGELLEREGYRVLAVENGRLALEAIRNTPGIEIALLDVMMPEMDGLEVCRAVKSRPETRLIPVVMVTGLAATEDRIRGIEAGADDFLNKPVNPEELTARVRSLLRLKHFTDELESAESVLFSLAQSIEAKDPYTRGHCERLSRYSVAMGKQMGLSDEELVALTRGGVVHDIGKVAVPEHILNKPARLTPDERRIMEQHSVVGESICSPLKSFRLVLPIIRNHHEKWDGSGYPDGLKGEAIPLLARILQTADVYDALSTKRPYREALSPQESFRIMREEAARGWWDTRLIDLFEGIILKGDRTK
jgi:putative two-component system response regulator